jgi:hypothetical protein
VNSAAVWFLVCIRSCFSDESRVVGEVWIVMQGCTSTSCKHILQECEDWDHTSWWDVDGKLVLPDAVLLNIFWQAREEVGAIFVECLGSCGISVCRVLDWAMESLSSCSSISNCTDNDSSRLHTRPLRISHVWNSAAGSQVGKTSSWNRSKHGLATLLCRRGQWTCKSHRHIE